ncbi:MmpS family transport accessory protein [Amycolatopsis pigmentata]|uniref:MmpS family transport accessory protein n=1 Tax=Amycolatopsis pigmentata TaxID=450801 RepID=A0ABW5G647_9PSEU
MRRPRSGPVVIIAGLAVIVAVGLVSALANPTPGARSRGTLAGGPTTTGVSPVPETLVTHTVRYELSGGTALNITYVTEGAAITQVSQAAAPWSATLERKAPAGSAQYYSISAQDTGAGTLKCRVLVDDVVQSERTVTSPHGVVRCSKTLT